MAGSRKSRAIASRLTTAAVGFTVLSAGGVSAQSNPSNFVQLNQLDGVDAVTPRADGTLSVLLSDGTQITFPADQVLIVDGAVWVSPEAMTQIQAAASAAIGSGGLSIGALAGAGALGAAAASSAASQGPSPNIAPSFTSAAAVSVEENTTAAVYTATATDADGDAITYSLSGADAALFDIDANTGEVTFKTAPDFEAPGDTDGDNIYDIVVTASDGTNSTDQAVAITVTNLDDQIIGTSGNDTLDGTSGADEIYGRGGNDTINGYAGDDRIFGEDGNDRIEGGLGDDYIDGGAGIDFLEYGYSTSNGNDTILAGSGNDTVYIHVNPNITAPTLYVDAGADDDTLYLINSHSGAVAVTALLGTGDDTVRFESQRTGGHYVIDLGDGNDTILVGANGRSGLGNIDLTLGLGRDTIDLQSLPNDLTIADFEAGASGDILRFDIASSLTNWSGSENPFASGHVRLVQQGADTIVQVDTDGGGDSWATLLTLSGVTASNLTSENFNGFDPDVRSAAQLDKLTSSDENPRWSEIFISLSEASAEAHSLFSMRSMKALPPLHDLGNHSLHGDSRDHYTPDEPIEPIRPLENLDGW